MKQYIVAVPILVVILMMLLVACASPLPTLTPNPTSTPTPPPTATSISPPTATPIPPPTATKAPPPSPSPSATFTPPSAGSTITPLPTATPSPTPAAVPTPAGKPGGKLTTVALANVAQLDVHQDVQETLTSLGPGIAYSRLLRLQTGPEDMVPQPSLLLECELCESWEMLDPLTYRFQLRKDVLWQKGVLWQGIDPLNGRELIAEDVVFSYERQRTPGWPNASLLQAIRTVEAEDRYALKITLVPGFANADFLLSLADGHTKVVPKEAVDAANGDLRNGPVIGSGPWIWDQERSREEVRSAFVKNPGYFEAGLPLLDELVVSVIKEEDTRIAAFVTGAVDVYRVDPETSTKLDRTGKAFNSFVSRQSGAGLILAMNVSASPFDNLQVRKAVLRALDPWDYVRTIWGEQGFVSLGIPVGGPDWLLTKEEMREAYFADPAAASELLRASGLPAPVRIELTVADFGDIHLRNGRRIEEDLKSAGFNPVFKRVTPPQYSDTVWRDKRYQVSVGQVPPTSTTNNFLFAILHGRGRWNVLGHSDVRLDSMIDAQAIETDPAARREQVKDIQRYILDQAYIFSPVTGSVTEGARWVFRPGVKGFYPNTSASEYSFWAKTWVE